MTRKSSKVCEIRPPQLLSGVDWPHLWHYRELLAFFVWRDVKVRYKQAAIGVAWAVIQPIVTAILFTFIFSRWAKVPSEGVPYTAFVFPSLIIWMYFAESLRRGSTGLVDDSDLIRKVYFPRMIIPLAGVSTPLADLVPSFVVLMFLLAVYGIIPSANLVFLPFFVLAAAAFALSISLFLAPINVRFRDVKHAVPFLIQIWMFASPVVYPASIVPDAWRWLYDLNPMTWIIQGFQWSLLGTAPPDPLAVVTGSVLIAFLLVGGNLFFANMERSFADII